MWRRAYYQGVGVLFNCWQEEDLSMRRGPRTEGLWIEVSFLFFVFPLAYCHMASSSKSF